MATLGDLLREWPGSGKHKDPGPGGHYDLSIPHFPGFAGHLKLTPSGEIVYEVEGFEPKPLKLHLAESTPEEAIAKAMQWFEENNYFRQWADRDYERDAVKDPEGYMDPADLVRSFPRESGRQRMHGQPVMPTGTM